METEFFGLSLCRKELIELQTALLQRYLVEDDLRREKGLEPIEDYALLRRVDDLLGLPDRDLDRLSENLEDELWEYSWFAFTEEWAWFRAKQEVRKELGAEAQKLSVEEIDRLTERRLAKHFEKYVREVEMKESETVKRQVAHRKA